MSLRTSVALLLFVALLVPLVRAQDEQDDGSLVVRFIEVGALTAGSVDYIPGVMGTVSPDMVSDEENPLFGAESEEPLLPLGTADELIELVKLNVEPVYWQITDGADVMCSSERTLVVRASRSVAAAVARYLAELEADFLTTVTIEVRAVPDLQAEGPGRLDALLAAEGPALTLTGLVRQRAAARVGQQFSYVQDYDVEVASDARIADPIVGVANWGLSVSARAVAAPQAQKLLVALDARLAVPTGMREHTSDETRKIELPTYKFVMLDADLALTSGTWTVAHGDTGGEPRPGDWVFLVRATASRPAVSAGAEARLLDPSMPGDTGPLVARRFDVSDLEEAVPSRQGSEMNLVPSNFTPPEPPELAEPMPLLPGEAIVEFVREFVAPGSWKRDGAFVEMRNGQLFVTNTERVLARVEELIAFMRRLRLWSVDTRAVLYDVPVGLGRRLMGTSGRLPLALDEALRDLHAALADGSAREAEAALVTSLSGARNSAFSGRLFTYIQDYEVEIAEKSVISNPIVQRAPEGLQVDLWPEPTSTGDAVNLAYKITRTRLPGAIRQVDTPHGLLDAPALDVLQLRGNLRVPLGATAVVGGGGDGGRMLVLLVTPVLAPYGG